MLNFDGIDDRWSNLPVSDALLMPGGDPMFCAGTGIGEPLAAGAQSTVVSETECS